MPRQVLLLPFIAALLLGTTACSSGAGPAPSSPTSTTAVIAVEVSCPTPLLVGEVESCVAVAHLSSGETPSVRADVTWSASPSGVLTVDASGAVRGQRDGQAVVAATYRGHTGDTLVSVTATDAIHLSALAFGGSFAAGRTATAQAKGFYSVDSAPTGQLRLAISDQLGTLLSTTPLIAPKGGDAFSLSATILIPQSSTKVCQTVVLTVGTHVVTAPDGPNAGVVGCTTVPSP